MYFYIILNLIIAITSIFLGFLVFVKNKKSSINLLFFFYCIGAFIWSLSYAIWLYQSDYNSALFWARMLNFGATLIPIAYFHWVLVFLKKDKEKKYYLFFGYFVTFLFLVFSFSDYYISSVKQVFSFSYWPQAGWLYVLYIIVCYGFLVFYGSYLLYSQFKIEKGLYSQQILYAFWGSIIGFLGGAFNFPLMVGLKYIPPVGNILVLAFPIVFVYAIATHRLMDIKLVLRQSTVYLATLVLTIIPPIILKYLSVKYIPNYAFGFDIILMIIAISLFPILRKKVYRFSNKYLFTSLYDSRKVIADISDQLGTTLEAKKIYKFVAKSLMDAFHTKAMAVLTFDKKGESFLISYNNGFKCDGKKIPIANHTEIYKQFVSRDKIIIFDEIRSYNVPGIKEFINEYNKVMGVDVLVPLTIKDKNIGVLALGAKESGDIYNKEDMEVLKVINSQVAISLENASLYEETKNFNIKLTKEVERATKELKEANIALQKLDEAKSEFISIASHQLRTPLTVIKGYVSMMLEGSFGKLDDKVDENLYKVYESNERLIHLVENLLNISRIESGRLQFNFDTVDLDDTVESVVEELAHTAKKKKVYLTYNSPKKKIPDINIDEEKIRQVIINVIDNSIKYTKRGGVTVKLEKVDSKIRFTVSDTGMGISKEDLPNLFKKFSRGKDTSLVHTEGTGLGLYVGKMMVEAHKGKIWAESKGVGKGSKFIFELPIKIKNPPKKLEGQVI